MLYVGLRAALLTYGCLLIKLWISFGNIPSGSGGGAKYPEVVYFATISSPYFLYNFNSLSILAANDADDVSKTNSFKKVAN